MLHYSATTSDNTAFLDDAIITTRYCQYYMQYPVRTQHCPSYSVLRSASVWYSSIDGHHHALLNQADSDQKLNLFDIITRHFCHFHPHPAAHPPHLFHPRRIRWVAPSAEEPRSHRAVSSEAERMASTVLLPRTLVTPHFKSVVLVAARA